MSETLLEQILAAVVKLALGVFGKDRTSALIAAEYDAADIAADALEDKKFPR